MNYFDYLGIILVATMVAVAINDNLNIGGQYIDD